MFNFKNLESLMYVKFKTLFKDVVPKGNLSMIDKEDYQDILSGTFLSMGLHIVLIINSIIISNISTDVAVAHMSFLNYIPLIYSVFILTDALYNYKNSTKVNGMFNYITIIVSFFYTIGILFLIFPWIGSMYISFIPAFISIICILGIVLANLFILSGTISFAEKIQKEYEEEQKNKIAQSEITVTRITQDEVADHSYKYCMLCGQKNELENVTCSRCGNML